MKQSGLGQPFIGQPSIAELLKRALDTTEGFGFMAPMLSAQALAWDLTDHQYMKLGGIHTFAASATVPAFAGTFSMALLANQLPSAKLLRVRQIRLSQGFAGTTKLWWGSFGGGAVPVIANSVAVPIGVRDTRIQNSAGAAGSSTGKVFTCTTLAPPTVGEGHFMTATPTAVPLDITLGPGGMLFIHNDVANQPFVFSVTWDERQAVGPELTMPG